MTITTKKPNPVNKPNSTNQLDATGKLSPPKKKFRRRKRWVRIVLAILRFLLVPFLCLVALYIGFVIGYVRLGGQTYSDIFKLETWKHIFDLVFSKI